MIAVVSLTAVPAAAQTGTPHRTAWGDPDLQGIWTGSTLTPFERPDDLAGKEFLTEVEVAAIEDEAARNQFVEPVPRQAVPGTYNQVWFDNGITVVPDVFARR